MALEADKELHPLWHRTQHVWGTAKKYRDKVKFDENLKDYNWTYTPECISEMMKIGRKEGFFVTWNHPTWSREDYSDYSQYSGCHAMEMFNGNANRDGFEEYNPRVYDDILRLGKKLYVVGGDDNHNSWPDDSRYSDSGWAWTVIKADKLEYRTITKALEKGNFYASEGPEIYELYVEDGKVHIKCSPADQVFITWQVRDAKMYLQKMVNS